MSDFKASRHWKNSVWVFQWLKKMAGVFTDLGKEVHFAVQGLDLADDFYTLVGS